MKLIKENVLTDLINYRNNMSEFDEVEMEYLIDLVRHDINNEYFTYS